VHYFQRRGEEGGESLSPLPQKKNFWRRHWKISVENKEKTEFERRHKETKAYVSSATYAEIIYHIMSDFFQTW